MADKFFEQETVEDQKTVETEETVKLGEKEYTQEELQRLVGLGEQAYELESKWDTKIDRLMPEYSKSREELKSLKEQKDLEARQRLEEKQAAGEGLTEDERIRMAKEEARKLGLVTVDDFDSYYQQRRAGEKLLEQVDSHVESMAKEGKPKTSTADLLQYMADTGVKDPKIAYKLMFEPELKRLEQEELSSLKPAGLYTQSSSTAGAKQPQPVAITKDNLGDLLTEVLSRSSGQ